MKESPTVAIVSPINGPGICGADFPLKVSSLGESPILGFADENVRPPANVPRAASAASPMPTSLSPVFQQDRPISSPGRSFVTAVAITPQATLACPIVSVLDRWIDEHVQPAARRWFGQPVTEIKQISAYSCRGMNGNPHAKISEHAFGNALDIAGFTLADGRKITVKDGWHGAPEEQGFLRDVHLSACEAFTTVLAPGYDAHHHDHIHVDLMRRESGRKTCRPDAMLGEVAAAKARAQNALLKGGHDRRLDDRLQ